jgi:hypothetical protein
MMHPVAEQLSRTCRLSGHFLLPSAHCHFTTLHWSRRHAPAFSPPEASDTNKQMHVMQGACPTSSRGRHCSDGTESADALSTLQTTAANGGSCSRSRAATRGMSCTNELHSVQEATGCKEGSRMLLRRPSALCLQHSPEWTAVRCRWRFRSCPAPPRRHAPGQG